MLIKYFTLASVRDYLFNNFPLGKYSASENDIAMRRWNRLVENIVVILGARFKCIDKLIDPERGRLTYGERLNYRGLAKVSICRCVVWASRPIFRAHLSQTIFSMEKFNSQWLKDIFTGDEILQFCKGGVSESRREVTGGIFSNLAKAWYPFKIHEFHSI
jgi:hypothetical protein